MGEVTFTFNRASRPNQTELIGTDDTAPYSIYWRPPADLADDEVITFSATFNDLRGGTASDEVNNVTLESHDIAFGITGSETPAVHVVKTSSGKLEAITTGTAPFEFQWLRDGEYLIDENNAWLNAPGPGNYRAVVRNRAGTTISPAKSAR
ncbi:hypothetical protein N9K67_05565 [Opitutaceae bacterium]|nr:hypothetical protein [Opitutaceae bacterium]